MEIKHPYSLHHNTDTRQKIAHCNRRDDPPLLRISKPDGPLTEEEKFPQVYRMD